MRQQTSRLTLVFLLACAAAIAASVGASAVRAGEMPQDPSAAVRNQTLPTVPPLVIEAVVLDKNGGVVTDMRAAEFQISVDGQARRDVAVAPLFRGPGAVGVAAGQQQAVPGVLPPRVEPSRLVVLVVDQGSFLPGDERRARAIAENCLGLLGLSDRVMFLRLPELSGTETSSADREPVRQELRLVQALRTRYSVSAESGAPEGAPIRVVEANPAQTGASAGDSPPAPEAADLEGLLRRPEGPGTETISAPAVKAHAVEMLEGLRRLLVAMQPSSAGGTVLLLSSGLVAGDAGREMEAATAAAATAFARIYTIQVPTPSPRFADQGRAGLIALARATGGTFVTLHDKPAQALQRVAGELAFSYLLMPAPVPSDQDGRLHSVSVGTPRKDVTIRTSLAVKTGRTVPDQVSAFLPPSAAPPATSGMATASGPGRPAARRDPALDAVVARVSDYVANYGREVTAVVSEEAYKQEAGLRLATRPDEATQLPGTRRLVSDFLMVRMPGLNVGWVPFRDVFEVDGVQVRDRDDRLRKLFLEAPVESAAESAKTLLDEGARYNIGNVARNMNLPTLALSLIHPATVSRFTFSKRGEPTEGGVRLWEVGFTEVARPTVVTTRAGADIVSSGSFWVEPMSGRVVRSRHIAAGATITVTYEPRAEALGMWVPVRMDEVYSYPSGSISATATYSKFRRFQVLTEVDVKTPDAPSPQGRAGYPAHWWAPVPREGAPDWEVLPQEAGPGEVIVSKRHELGLLSNFAATPFVFRGVRYASLEGFWQMMLYPEGPDDPRARFPGVRWIYTRTQVAQLTGFEAKDAGTLAEQNMARVGITWVSFEGERFEYRPDRPGRHYALIVAAMREKVRQNAEVRKVLLATGELVLRPDHHEEANAREAWRYCSILMQLRAELRGGQ